LEWSKINLSNDWKALVRISLDEAFSHMTF